MKSKPTRIKNESQLAKVEKNLNKLKRQIARQKAEKNLSTTSLEKKAYLEGAILANEKKLTVSTINLLALQNKIIAQMEKEQKTKLTLNQRMRVAIANADKIQEGKPPTQGNDFFRPFTSGKGEVREKIDNTGGVRKVKRKWVYLERNRNPKDESKGKVTVKNPNRKYEKDGKYFDVTQ